MSHVGKLANPVLHWLHFSPVILSLQIQTPLELQSEPSDPSSSQSQPFHKKIVALIILVTISKVCVLWQSGNPKYPGIQRSQDIPST